MLGQFALLPFNHRLTATETDDALELRIENGLKANDHFRNEIATARVTWRF